MRIEGGEAVEIDGSRGEGGGQVLRTSLALAMLTGRRLHMRRIRAGRAKPGLRRQHLACVEAAARLCHAAVRGAELASQELDFTPGPITGGHLEIDIGTAGSTTLVVQTILVPAIAAGVALRATIRGGTHNPLAPPFEFVERVYLPLLRAMGAEAELVLDRHGFASGGGGGRDPQGQLTLTVGASRLQPIELIEAAPVTARRATVIVSRLPTHVADREIGVIRRRLGFAADECSVREVRDAAIGNALLLEIERGQLGPSEAPGVGLLPDDPESAKRGTSGRKYAAEPGRSTGSVASRELVSSLGEKGLRAEVVAERACDELARLLAANVPVGEHLADQLILPLAVAGGGRFRTLPLSLHAATNIETIGQFLDCPIRVAPDGDCAIVSVG